MRLHRHFQKPAIESEKADDTSPTTAVPTITDPVVEAQPQPVVPHADAPSDPALATPAGDPDNHSLASADTQAGNQDSPATPEADLGGFASDSVNEAVEGLQEVLTQLRATPPSSESEYRFATLAIKGYSHTLPGIADLIVPATESYTDIAMLGKTLEHQLANTVEMAQSLLKTSTDP